MEVDDTMIDGDTLEGESMETDAPMGVASDAPSFPPLSAADMQDGNDQFRRIPVPPHRYTPLKESWMEIFEPVVKHMQLQIRMNTATRNVELKVSRRSLKVSLCVDLPRDNRPGRVAKVCRLCEGVYAWILCQGETARCLF